MNLRRPVSMNSENSAYNTKMSEYGMWSHVLACIAFTIMTSIGVNADEWMKTYDWNGRGGKGCHMEQLPDSGYIIVGEAHDSWYRARIWLLRTDSSGDTLWTRVYEDTVPIDCYCVRRTDDKGYIIAGARNESHNCTRGLLIKTDSLGDSLWARTYGSSPGSCRPRCIQKTDDGGYIMVGSSSEGPGGVWLARVDSIGDTLWTKIYGSVQYPSSGRWIEKTRDGGYIMAARRGPGSNDDIWLMKTDSLGDTLWTRLYGGDNTDSPSCVRQTSDSGYIIVGHGKDYCSIEHVWLIKVDSVGDTVWTRFFLPGGDHTDDAWGKCVQETNEKSYVVTGQMMDSTYRGKSFLTEVSSSGSVLSEHRSPDSWGPAIGNCVVQTPCGGYTVLGSGRGGLLLYHVNQLSVVEQRRDVRGKGVSFHVHPNPATCRVVVVTRSQREPKSKLALHDLAGNKIQEFTFTRRIEWRIPKDLPSGCYFLRLQAGAYKETRKLCVLKGV